MIDGPINGGLDVYLVPTRPTYLRTTYYLLPFSYENVSNIGAKSPH